MASIASQLDPATVDRAYRLLGPDDKGIVDFVSLALRVFGLHVEGVFWLYVVVLGVSCGLFALAYLRRPAQLALLTCFLTMLFLIVPMLAFNRQVDSLLALRVFPVLSMVACLHALVFVARPSASRWQIGLLVAQVTLIILVEHIRSTAAWQIVALAAATLAVVVVRFRSWRASASQPRECWLRLGLASCPLVLVLAGHLALDRYRAWVFPAEYQRGEQTLARMVWHNVYSGFALQPELAQRYDLRIDDTSIIRATGQYLDETGRGTEWTEMGGTSPNFTAIRWAPYDQAVKDMLFARCTALARQCLTAFALDKPAALAGDLAWTYGLRELPPGVDVFTSLAAGDTVKTQVIEASERLDRTATRAHLWMPAVLALLLVLAASMTGASRPDCLAVAFAAAFLWAGSLVPSIVGYPAPHAVAEPAIATGMLIYLGLCGLAVGVIGRVRQMAGSSARPE
jgi:hypothetical protein